MLFAWQAQGFRALWCWCLKHLTQNPWEGCKFHVTEVLLCRDHFAWQLQEFVCLGSTFSWQAQYFWSIHLKIAKTYWNSDVKCLLNMSILKEVSQKCFVFDLQSFIFEGSLAEKLRFWASKLQFWRKSRRNASFLIFKASFLKEVSQKSFVLELQSFNFEGSLAEMVGFGVSKFRFLKEVSQKGFVFWASQFQFWRKSRRNGSFVIFKVLCLKEVPQKSFVFELQKASILKEVSQKSFVWQKNHLNHTSVYNQTTWTSNHLTSKSLESQINWQPTHLNLKSTDKQKQSNHTSIDNQIIWISNQLTTNSLESQIDWQPRHLNLNLIDNQIALISNQLTTTSLEAQTNRQPKSFETHPLTTKSFESQITWQSKSLESHFTWIWHQLTFEPIELRTPPSYRFLIFGNFRHRLAR